MSEGHGHRVRWLKGMNVRTTQMCCRIYRTTLSTESNNVLQL